MFVGRVFGRATRLPWVNVRARTQAIKSGSYFFSTDSSSKKKDEDSVVDQTPQNFVTVDRSNLGVPYPVTEPKKGIDNGPLTRILEGMIRTQGPISVQEFMQICLTHPKYGYYTKESVFGTQGDFTTSPEISQLFGEMVGIWCVAAFESLGQPEKIRIVELGPGKGTLMSDIVRTVTSFPSFASALSKGGVAFVEASSTLRSSQSERLNCDPSSVEEADINGLPFGSKVMSGLSNTGEAAGPVPIDWFTELDHVIHHTKDDDVPVLVIAQEFFDALPVQQYQLTEKGWCERMVDLKHPNHEAEGDDEEDLGFSFVLNDVATPVDQNEAEKKFPEGQSVEVGGAAMSVSRDLAQFIASKRGGALVVDYGQSSLITNSLRGIREHKFVHPLTSPGLVDLSVDVNFDAIRKAALSVNKSVQSSELPQVITGGAIEQGEFLLRMGIQARANQLHQAARTPEQAEDVVRGFRRLVDPDFGGMGSTYKVLAMLAPNTPGNFPPGFSPDECA